MRFWVLAGVVALAGCSEKPVEEMGYAELSALAKEIEQRCTDLGLTPGTPQHQQCGKIEAQKEITTRRANYERRQRQLDAVGQSMQAYSDGYNRAATANQSSNINCTHHSYSGYSTTRCY